MSAALYLASMDDLDKLEPMVAGYHAFEGIDTTEENRRAALTPLLEGTPLGVAYLIDEFFIRENVRGRGMGTEVLTSLLPALGQHGVKALHLEVDPKNSGAQRVYTRAGFRLRDGYCLMTKRY